MKKEIDFPDCWEELQPAEWVCLLKLRNLLMTQRGVSLTDVKRAWCAFVLKSRGMKVRQRKPDELLLADRLAETLDWMWLIDDEEQCVSLHFDTTRNLLPEYKGLRGPQSHGGDLTFGEFRAATAAMNLYTEDHLPSDLLALVAVLYRFPDPATGKRAPFDPDDLPTLMRDVQRVMPDWLQWGIYAWFARFCEYLLTGKFVIDGQTTETVVGYYVIEYDVTLGTTYFEEYLLKLQKDYPAAVITADEGSVTHYTAVFADGKKARIILEDAGRMLIV